MLSIFHVLVRQYLMREFWSAEVLWLYVLETAVLIYKINCYCSSSFAKPSNSLHLFLKSTLMIIQNGCEFHLPTTSSDREVLFYHEENIKLKVSFI